MKVCLNQLYIRVLLKEGPWYGYNFVNVNVRLKKLITTVTCC